MSKPPAIAWLLLALTCLVAVLGLNPRIRHKWHWGRTQTSIPMSTFGAVIGIGALAMLTVTAFGLLPFYFIFLSLLLVLVGALYDSWLDRRAKRRNTRG